MNRLARAVLTPITMLALLGLLAFGANWGYQLYTSSAAAPRPAAICQMQDVGKTLTTDRVTVRVLNGGGSGGLAKRTALYLRAFGFPAPYYNNSERRVNTTIIVGHAADSPEVRLVQQFFAGSTTEGDGRSDHTVDVILGDRNAQVPTPVTTIAVDGPVCLPPVAGSANPSGKATPSGEASSTGSAVPTATPGG